MNVAMHHVGFPLFGNHIATQCHNATNALCNIEYFYRSGLCVEFA